MPIQFTCIAVAFLLLLYVASQRAHRAVYACTIVWLIYPNWGTNLFGIMGLPLFFYLEMAMTAVLWGKILTCPRRKKITPIRREVRLQRLFWITVVLQYALGTWMVGTLLPLDNTDAFLTYLLGLGHVVAGLTFFQACLTFIGTERQITVLLKIYFYFAVILGFELLATLFVPAINAALYFFTIKLGLGNFYSVFLNDFQAVLLVCAAGFLAALYFWYERRRLRYIFGAAVIALPIFFNVTSRAVVLSFIVAVTFFLGCRIKKQMLYLIMTCMALTAIIVVMNMTAVMQARGSFLKKIASYATSQRHKSQLIKSFAATSIYARLGIQARGLDVAMRVMPFGVGEDMARHYMSLPIKRLWHFGPDTHPEIRINYNEVRSGDKVTEVHNGYTDCFMSFGILGLVALAATLKNIWLNWKAAKRISPHSNLGLLRDVVFAMGIVILGKNLLLSNPKIYVIVFVLLHTSFLLALNRDTFSRTN